MRPEAELQLKNSGAEALARLEVQVQTAGLTSTTPLPALPPGGTFSMRFYVAGEGGIQIRRQGEPKPLHSQYVEAGNRLAITLP